MIPSGKCPSQGMPSEPRDSPGTNAGCVSQLSIEVYLPADRENPDRNPQNVQMSSSDGYSLLSDPS